MISKPGLQETHAKEPTEFTHFCPGHCSSFSHSSTSEHAGQTHTHEHTEHGLIFSRQEFASIGLFFSVKTNAQSKYTPEMQSYASILKI